MILLKTVFALSLSLVVVDATDYCAEQPELPNCPVTCPDGEFINPVCESGLRAAFFATMTPVYATACSMQEAAHESHGDEMESLNDWYADCLTWQAQGRQTLNCDMVYNGIKQELDDLLEEDLQAADDYVAGEEASAAAAYCSGLQGCCTDELSPLGGSNPLFVAVPNARLYPSQSKVVACAPCAL